MNNPKNPLDIEATWNSRECHMCVEEDEFDRVAALLQTQAAEIERLKAEIKRLTRYIDQLEGLQKALHAKELQDENA